MTIKVLFEDCSVKVSYMESSQAKSRGVCVCFTGVGHALGGIEVQNEEFKNVDAFSYILFITDKKRTWGNGLDLDFILSLLRPFFFGRDVYLIGNSMGGFISTVFSRYINARVCLNFSPQYSVDSDLIDEDRWKVYRDDIGNIRFKSIDSYFNDDTAYYLFFGDALSEERHWSRLKAKDNVSCFVAVGECHRLVVSLKEKGVLYDLIKKCFSNKNKQEISDFLINSGVPVLV